VEPAKRNRRQQLERVSLIIEKIPQNNFTQNIYSDKCVVFFLKIVGDVSENDGVFTEQTAEVRASSPRPLILEDASWVVELKPKK
jgi:hypothetical protein